MGKPHTSSSIHALPPLERGGVVARHGFDVQDHVAAGFVLSMLELPELLQVWCETHDDITLIWQGQSGEEIEFVQVKSNELDQLWSVSKLCEREKKDKASKAGTSIYERSLANDRCVEPCRFRLVTCRPVQSDLYVLTLPHSAPDRATKHADFDALSKDIETKANGFQSHNGNGPAYWLSRLLWDVRHSIENVTNANLDKLRRLVESQGGYLFSDQLDDLYATILTMVRSASVADWGVDPSRKKFTNQEVKDWFGRELARRLHSIPATGGTALKGKMEQAGIFASEVESSLETRRHYLSERLRPQYLSLTEREHVEGEVAATLHALRAQLDAGEITDSGVAFHARCISALQDLQRSLPTSRPVPLVFLIGCMYSIADRCTHRFRRASA
ncbi:MAG: dsDNA nuclease domain-containing protein [Planctomycetaceae bacterium]